AEAEGTAELDGVGRAGEERVGAALDRDAGEVVGADLATGPVGRLQDGHVGPVAEEPRRRQAGDAGADDHHPLPGHAVAPWTSSTTRVSVSGSVSGSTP